MNYTLAIIIVIFLAGFYFVSTHTTGDVIEGFGKYDNCPNLLLKKGNRYYLHNTTKANVPGVNPIEFKNLEDYVEFIHWLRSKGINCPILYLQQTYDTQGTRTYRVLPDPIEPNAGLPPALVLPTNQQQPALVPNETKLYDAGHNKGAMPGFDSQNQYIGDYTPLDKMFHENDSKSDNPMDTQWGGAIYSEEVVESGKYAGDVASPSEDFG